mmetsp:Transcript_6882/g.28738  ORF Transcript_6882/g.28738 Transcript_6882/m.28738 type:complete len:157 (-) Transcript_6882:250-720(-)
MQDILDDKEFQLWEKEGLLEYQEDRLLHTEDIEIEMQGYIFAMAETLVTHNKTLPKGLVDEPWFNLPSLNGEHGLADAAARRSAAEEPARRRLAAVEGDGDESSLRGRRRPQAQTGEPRLVAPSTIVGGGHQQQHHGGHHRRRPREEDHRRGLWSP